MQANTHSKEKHGKSNRIASVAAEPKQSTMMASAKPPRLRLILLCARLIRIHTCSRIGCAANIFTYSDKRRILKYTEVEFVMAASTNELMRRRQRQQKHNTRLTHTNVALALLLCFFLHSIRSGYAMYKAATRTLGARYCVHFKWRQTATKSI